LGPFRIHSSEFFSDFPIPDSSTSLIDVSLQRCPPPETLPNATQIGDFAHLQGKNLVLNFEFGLRFYISDRNEIFYDYPTDTDERLFKLRLLGTVWCALCFLNGLLPIHASAVLPPEGHQVRDLVAFSGPPGAGKSTIIAGLMKRGWQIFADDLIAMGGAGQGNLAYPGHKLLRLSEATCEHLNLGKGPEVLPESIWKYFQVEKKVYAETDFFKNINPVILKSIFIISNNEGYTTPKICKKVTGHQKLVKFGKCIQYIDGAKEFIGNREIMENIISATNGMEIYDLRTVHNWDRFDDTLDLIEKSIFSSD